MLQLVELDAVGSIPPVEGKLDDGILPELRLLPVLGPQAVLGEAQFDTLNIAADTAHSKDIAQKCIRVIAMEFQ